MTRPHFENAPLAIIGMSCRLPGADGLDQFWHLLRSGGSGLAELPPDRFDRELYYHPKKGTRNKSYSSLGGLVSPRPFDRDACPLPQELIDRADVAHLTLCEVAASACRHARLDPFDLPLRNTGVFVGHTAASPLASQVAYSASVADMAAYLSEIDSIRALPAAERDGMIRDIVAQVRREQPRIERGIPLDLSSQAAAGLITAGFGLTGPYLVVDAACASSLQALMVGASALRQGRIDMAIVGGASYVKADTLVLFSHAQSLSATGSRPFDADADGLILAEGYVVLVVKTVARALADGDPIQAVIRGIGMATDGRGKSLWAPRKEGQVLAIQRAYEPDLDVKSLQYIEAHATSTALGDATELHALAEALSGQLPPGTKIPIGSVKANVGHTLKCAGLAGLAKTVLAMQNAIVPPAVNCKRLNGEIDWQQAPFFVPTSEIPWPEGQHGRPRRAGVNSFGIGGLNVHVVLDEFPELRAARTAPRPIARSQDIAASPDEPEAVAIVGAGCILPGARTLEAFWELLAAGRDGKSAVPNGRWHAANEDARDVPSIGGFITDYAYDWKRHVVPPKQVEQANPLQFMLLDATEAALADAGYDRKPLDRSRTGVIVGTIFGDEFAQQLNMGLRLPQFQRTLAEVLGARGVEPQAIDEVARRFADVLLKHMPALVDETGSFTSSTLASRITKAFDLQGGALAMDAGAASGLAVVAAGVDLLLSGVCDAVVCAAGERNMSRLSFEAYGADGKLARGDIRSPFDAKASGSVPGEGVGVVLLKRLSDARRDGDRVRAIVRGWGAAAGDQMHDTARLAMRRALRCAQVRADQVSTVEINSPGTAAADSKHASAIAETYGSADRQQPLVVGSLTGQIGHTMAASGMAGLIKSALSLEHASSPANVGLDQAAPWLAEKSKQIVANSQLARLTTADPQGHLFAGVTACVDERLAYHFILERGTAVVADKSARGLTTSPAQVATAAQTVDQKWRTVRISAASLGELTAKVQTAADACEALFAAAASSTFGKGDAWRLALAVDSVESLATKLRLAAGQVANPAGRTPLEEQGIFCREVPSTRPRVAFLFPGQGSQYAGMLAELIRDFPAAAAARREVDAAMALLGLPGFEELSTDAGGQLGVDVFRTQVAMLLADVILLRSLSSLHVEPSVIGAHSYGEFPALVAAGAWNLEQAIGATAARCRSIDTTWSGPESQMLSTSAPADVVERLIGSLAEVYVSHHNAPDQTVVAGRTSAVDELAARLRAEKFDTRPLAVPRPFHTPLLAGAQEPFRRALDAAWIAAPRVPLTSGVTCQMVRDADEIRAILVNQLTNPVRYVDLVRHLATSGVTIFVEVGPQQVLTRLNRRILAGTAAVCIASDNSKRPGVEQLCRVRALLECAGALDEAEQRPVAAMPAAESRPREPLSSEFVNFDATQRRKAKLRGAAAVPSTAPSTADDAPQPAPTLARSDAPNGSAPAPPMTISTHLPANGSATSHATVAPAVAAPQSAGGARAAVRARSNAPRPEELESFLVNFVIEQTGYPPEIVRLDADLEADLGIDSIKKAQLFGELAEFYDVTSPENLRLDDFPTLRHVLGFLNSAPTDGNGVEPTVPVAASAIAAALALAPSGSAAPTSNGTHAATAVMESRAAAPAGAVSTQRGSASVRARENAPPLAELEQFLVNFVIEQTGYPAEIVRLDADLEADLGIDSIKKAQLFGELAEFFDVTSPENLRLDDFPTLRHVLAFLQSSSDDTVAVEPIAPGAVVESAAPPVPASPATIPAIETPSADEKCETVSIRASSQCISVVTLSGTPYEMGRQHGQQQRSQILAMLKRFAELSAVSPVDVPRLVKILTMPGTWFAKDELEEMQGIADGAGVHLGNIIAHALAFDGQRVAGVQVAVAARRNGANGMLHAAQDEMSLSVGFADCLTRVAQVRCPTDGVPHVILGIAGQASGLAGMNAAGIGCTANWLSSPEHAPIVDAAHRPAALVKALLQSARDVDGAVELVEQFPDGGWSVCVSHHPTDRICYLERDRQSRLVRHDSDLVLCTDHGLLGDPARKATEESSKRLDRLQAALAGALSVSEMQAAMSNEVEATPDAGRAHAHTSVVVRPSTGEMWVATDKKGDITDFQRINVAELLRSETAPAVATDKVSRPEPSPAPPITQRLVLRMMNAPLPASISDSSFVPSGAVLIWGDNPLARALERRFASPRTKVLVIAASEPWNKVRDEFHRLWSEQPIAHLFLTTPHDAKARDWRGEMAWRGRFERGVIMPFLLCQEWIARVSEAQLASSATLVAATALGGDSGASGNIHSIEGGAFTGLVKSLYIESLYESWKGVQFRALDFGLDVPHEAAAAMICRELGHDLPHLEVGFTGGQRRIVRTVAQPVGEPRPDNAPRGTWVVTGGARGVTAVVALALGRRFNLKLHLLGLSPAPQIDPSWRTLSPEGVAQLKASVMRQAGASGRPPHEEWTKIDKAMQIDRTLRACAEAGVSATYHACDASNWGQLASVLDAIRATDGPIEGILHGAAIIRDGVFERKKLANVRLTFAAKADAAAALMELTENDPLRHFVAFSSVSGRFGMRGQADYAAANELLAKQIGAFRSRRPKCHSVAVHWHAWDEVGLAVRPELQKTFASLDVKFMPPAEGIEHLVREIEAGLTDSEVVFIDEAYYRKQYPIPAFATLDEVAAAESQAAPVAPDVLAAAPLLDRLCEHEPGRKLSAEVRFDPRIDPFLIEHRLGGKPILPFVIAIESLAEAARAAGGGQVAGLQNIEIHNALQFKDELPKTVQVTASVPDDGPVCCRLTSEFRDREGRLVDAARMHVAANVELAPHSAVLNVDPAGQPPLGWHPMAYPDDAAIYHGPRFRCLKQVGFQYDGGFGQIVAPPMDELGGARKGPWIVPAAILDACMVACGTFAYCMFSKRIEIPAGIDRLRLGRPPRGGEVCVMRMYYRGQVGRMARYDFNLFGDDGQCLLSVEGYRAVGLTEG